jgi:hypothetical protein
METRSLIWGGFLSVALCGAALLALQYGRGRLPMVHSNAMVIHAKMAPKIEFRYEPRDAREGSVVRLQAVVSAEGDGPMPTGKVNFLHGWNIFVGGKLVNGTVTVEAKVPEGRLPLNALYTGDSIYRSVSSVEKGR